MDARVEVVAVTAEATVITPVIRAVVRTLYRVFYVLRKTTTSTLVRLSQGRSSLTAIPGNSNFMNGGHAVPAVA